MTQSQVFHFQKSQTAGMLCLMTESMTMMAGVSGHSWVATVPTDLGGSHFPLKAVQRDRVTSL